MTTDTSQISDGYHTFAELYEHRHSLCLALMRALPGRCWFSRRHNDGELCFGSGEWFIIGCDLSEEESVTYHLPICLYPVAQATGALELDRGKPWDGHTATDVTQRLQRWAGSEAPSVWDIGVCYAKAFSQSKAQHSKGCNDALHREFALKAVFQLGVDHGMSLAGHTTSVTLSPILVTERLPKAEDCCPHPRRGTGEWCWGLERSKTSYGMPRSWRFMRLEDVGFTDSDGLCHPLEAQAWLPHWALPLLTPLLVR